MNNNVTKSHEPDEESQNDVTSNHAKRYPKKLIFIAILFFAGSCVYFNLPPPNPLPDSDGGFWFLDRLCLTSFLFIIGILVLLIPSFTNRLKKKKD